MIGELPPKFIRPRSQAGPCRGVQRTPRGRLRPGGAIVPVRSGGRFGLETTHAVGADALPVRAGRPHRRSSGRLQGRRTYHRCPAARPPPGHAQRAGETPRHARTRPEGCAEGHRGGLPALGGAGSAGGRSRTAGRPASPRAPSRRHGTAGGSCQCVAPPASSPGRRGWRAACVIAVRRCRMVGRPAVYARSRVVRRRRDPFHRLGWPWRTRDRPWRTRDRGRRHGGSNGPNPERVAERFPGRRWHRSQHRPPALLSAPLSAPPAGTAFGTARWHRALRRPLSADAA
jgi:hypothetical protein